MVKKAASNELWKRGEIRAFILDAVQQSMANEFDKSEGIKHVILCSRRLGKSYMLCTLAIEAALQKPNQYIKYLTTSTKAAKEIVLPLIGQILNSCPATVRPEFHVHDSKWKFQNGSEILLHGVDKDSGEGLRGQAADLAIIDEAGFITNLDSIVKDILMPMVVERNGRVLLSSTPPMNADHDFINYIAQAEKNKALTLRILTDCPRFTKKQIETFIEEAGGIDSDTCQREYFCKIIRNMDDAVIPEFTDVLSKKLIVSEFPKLNYIPTRYVSLDVGFVDNSGALFAYFDFSRAKICIQREYISKAATTDDIADGIKRIEKELGWNNQSDKIRRFSDTDLRLIADLQKLYDIRFKKTEKDNKEATINLVRSLIKDGQIEIHESCVNLIQQLKYGYWKTSSSGKRVFGRSDQLGHLDLLDALIYLIRNVKRNDPPPMVNQGYSYWGSVQTSSTASSLRNLFNR